MDWFWSNILGGGGGGGEEGDKGKGISEMGRVEDGGGGEEEGKVSRQARRS